MSSTEDYYDDLETRDPEQREQDNLKKLSAQIAHAKTNSVYYKEILEGIDPADINNREALSQLPTTRKSDLAVYQKKQPPLGGLNAVPLSELRHIFASPGGIYEPAGYDKDYWRYARALWAAGGRPGQIIHNTFSYHLTPAAALVESGASAIGCPVFPGGVGNTELQLQAISDVKPDIYAGTPSFLRILLEKAQEAGIDISSIKRGLVGGEALPPSLRQHLADLGVNVLQGYGTADLGSVAYESNAMEGMILDEGVFVELVEPLGTKPVAEGEVGEIVVTTFNPIYPLIRFATGDLSAYLPGGSPCGRTNTRIKGWMGRADQSTKVRGMFVHASQMMELAGRHPEIKKARLVISSIDNKDQMTLRASVEGGGSDALSGKIAETIVAIMKVRGEVEFVEPDSLPDDGKVIDDIRSYE